MRNVRCLSQRRSPAHARFVSFSPSATISCSQYNGRCAQCMLINDRAMGNSEAACCKPNPGGRCSATLPNGLLVSGRCNYDTTCDGMCQMDCCARNVLIAFYARRVYRMRDMQPYTHLMHTHTTHTHDAHKPTHNHVYLSSLHHEQRRLEVRDRAQEPPSRTAVARG